MTSRTFPHTADCTAHQECFHPYSAEHPIYGLDGWIDASRCNCHVAEIKRQAEEIARLKEALTDLRDNLLETGHSHESWMVRDIKAALT